LGRSGWQPESLDLKSVYQQILADAGDKAPPPAKKPIATSSLFEQWLAQGASGELARLDETALRERLKKATPPEGAAIVAALAAKKPSSSAAAQAVRESPHWLVRLAGHAAGLIGPDLTQDSVQDFNYWITELASAAGPLGRAAGGVGRQTRGRTQGAADDHGPSHHHGHFRADGRRSR
jgi:hypothetical protein